MFSWPHYFQMLPYFSFPLQQNSFKKLSVLAVSNVSSHFFSWTHSTQASAPATAMKLLFSRSSVLLKSSCNLLVLFLFAWLVAFDTVAYSLFFPWLPAHHTRLLSLINFWLLPLNLFCWFLLILSISKIWSSSWLNPWTSFLYLHHCLVISSCIMAPKYSSIF